MPTIDELIGCIYVLATIVGICLAWLAFFSVMIGG